MKEIIERIELVQAIEIDIARKYIFAIEGPVFDEELVRMKKVIQRLWNDPGCSFIVLALPKGHKVKISHQVDFISTGPESSRIDKGTEIDFGCDSDN